METGNFILKIRSLYNQFTKAEKKVADYVVKNQKQVIFMSITDLADACNVGDTSVYRFCRTLNLSGYQEFKMKLSLSLAEEKDSVRNRHEELVQNDDLMRHGQELIQTQMSALQETCKLLDHATFDKVLELFENAKRVFFFGIGDSLLTAEEARNKFLRITGKVHCITDPHMQAMAATMMGEEDLIVIISYSGATKDNIQMAKVAKREGAKIVCITRFERSPLTAYSDATLLCGSNESPLEGGSMAAKMSQLYLIDLLFQQFYHKTFEVSAENNKKTSAAVVEKLF